MKGVILNRILILVLVALLFSCSATEIEQTVEQNIVQEDVYNTQESVIPNDSFTPPMEKFRISSKFGFRTHPLGGEEFDLHKGVDLVGPKNSKILATKEGTVVVHFPPPNAYYRGHPIFGGLIIIYHGDGVYTLYGHLKTSYVREGQKISQGEIIGVQGSTGISTGPHLHFEIIIDPEIALKQ